MRAQGPEGKVLTADQVVTRFGRPRKGRLVFTNGCFDLLHRGHVAYLAEARALGDYLVVGVNTDASFRRLDKGPGRPVVPEADRAYLLAALANVDAVCLFDEDTPRALISRLLPDVLVKGGDYRLADVVGRDEVEAAGGRVVLIPFVEGYSTTELIRRIREET
jgi:D-beta-D-heptose 7-phosphate kinase/D-beta-D-heptose 1-phosphate adenosyltransferase